KGRDRERAHHNRRYRWLGGMPPSSWAPDPWYVAEIEREIFSFSYPDYPAGLGTSLLPSPEVSAWPAYPAVPPTARGDPPRSPSRRAPSIPGSSRPGPSTSAPSPSTAPSTAPNGCSPISTENILIEPTVVEHTRRGLDDLTARIRRAMTDYDL